MSLFSAFFITLQYAVLTSFYEINTHVHGLMVCLFLQGYNKHKAYIAAQGKHPRYLFNNH